MQPIFACESFGYPRPLPVNSVFHIRQHQVVHSVPDQGVTVALVMVILAIIISSRLKRI